MFIAPCGIDCRLCRAYTRDRKPCPGCRGNDCQKSDACITCVIKNCKELVTGNHLFCFSCAQFPCVHLRHLDDRYRVQYSVSVLANLERIKAVGVETFVTEETSRWTCPECDMLLCMHKPQCLNCGYTWQGQ